VTTITPVLPETPVRTTVSASELPQCVRLLLNVTMLERVILQPERVALLLSFLALLVLITTPVQTETHATAVVPASPEHPKSVLRQANAISLAYATPHQEPAPPYSPPELPVTITTPVL